MYPVVVTVTDNGGLQSTVSRNVVVYDPSAGFVTGSGWIQSPPGAYKPTRARWARATFSFVSKYQKGAKTPTGTTDLHASRPSTSNSISEVYDRLVVGGARAQFKGIGQPERSRRLQVHAHRGRRQDQPPAMVHPIASGSRSRITTMPLKQDVIDYDNQLDSGSEGTNQEGTAIREGNIVVHAAKN